MSASLVISRRKWSWLNLGSFAGAAGAVALRRWLHGRGGARLTFINAVLRACALGLIGCLALAGLLGPAGYVALLGVSSLLSAWVWRALSRVRAADSRQ